MAAYLAPCLVAGRAEVDARWPGRSRASDGWIGDPAHQATKSDHNPARPSGVVRATDTTTAGIDPDAYVAACCRHPSTRYVIYNGVIRHRRDGFKPHKYTGSNKHVKHVHRSIEATIAAERNTQPLGLAGAGLAAPTAGAAPPAPPLSRTMAYNKSALMTGADVKRYQQRLKDRGWTIAVDGEFGPATEAVTRKFQRDKGLSVDGEVGPNTWAAVWLSPVT